ncbi:unnamed protein product [Allacma fusca]|uniref:Uncharacterized protein n=1 Tax=Allacma fusca TaxID=39272 RepID=A0A8J2KFQ9_9HEXA|nr:unnamed protein product [Allacma fusca]
MYRITPIRICILAVALLYSSFVEGALEEHSELFLTPLIKSGDLAKAKELSADHMKNFHIKSSTNEKLQSFSGYLNVNDTTNSNLFFWFFPALETPQKAPVIMWLNEVAGSSCLKGVFVENGPFYVDDNLQLRDREFTWVKKYSLLYLDVPVGSGFSFTDKEDGYAKNSEDDANEVFEALQQFFTLFSEFQAPDLYFAGEGASANHIPRMVKRVEEGNKAEKLKINLKGFMVGSPFLDMKFQTTFSSSWFSMGLIDREQRKEVEAVENKIQSLIQEKKLEDAHVELFKLIIASNTLYSKFTGHVGQQLNYLNGTDPRVLTNFAKFIEDKEVHNYLHVGLHNFEIFNFKVHDKFRSEIMAGDGKSMAGVLDGYKVLIYSGQMDPVAVHSQVTKTVEGFEWSGAAELKKTSRKIWKVGDDVAGYVKSVGKFHYVMMRKTGRYAAMDQPAWAFQMVQNFIDDKPF